MSHKIGIIVYPGSNCDNDCRYVMQDLLNCDVKMIWHRETDLGKVDALIIPGGFSYGDYLRSGAIAKFSPIMPELLRFAQQGGPVLGICNGFQVLTECGLLPGALMRNRDLKFICDTPYIKITQTDSQFSSAYDKDVVLKIPIAHHDGNYFIDAQGLQKLESEGQVVMRYVDAAGEASLEANPNGSLNNIAAIKNRTGNVVGMMPHPERMSELALGGLDGLKVFQSVL